MFSSYDYYFSFSFVLKKVSKLNYPINLLSNQPLFFALEIYVTFYFILYVKIYIDLKSSNINVIISLSTNFCSLFDFCGYVVVKLGFLVTLIVWR